KEEIKKREKISSEIQEEELKVNRMDVMLETKINHLQTTYAISYDKAKAEYEETSDIESATVEVDQLKNEIKQLGQVNTGEIEEIKKREKISSEIQEEELKVNRMDVMLETKINHLQTTYAISYDKAKAEYEETSDIESATVEVDQLKNEIKQLGQVNTGAIEEFNRIKERLAFITAQQEDLLEAKQTLYEVISEMDQEMITLFTETFYQIQKEFQNVFKE